MGVLAGEDLDITQQCVLAAYKVNCVMGSLKRNVTRRSTKVIVLCSALMSSHLEYCVQFWSSQDKKDVDVLEWVKRGLLK